MGIPLPSLRALRSWCEVRLLRRATVNRPVWPGARGNQQAQAIVVDHEGPVFLGRMKLLIPLVFRSQEDFQSFRKSRRARNSRSLFEVLGNPDWFARGHATIVPGALAREEPLSRGPRCLGECEANVCYAGRNVYCQSRTSPADKRITLLRAGRLAS